MTHAENQARAPSVEETGSAVRAALSRHGLPTWHPEHDQTWPQAAEAAIGTMGARQAYAAVIVAAIVLKDVLGCPVGVSVETPGRPS